MKTPIKRKTAPKDGTVQLSEKHYIIYGVPREIPLGMVLVHNQVRHTLKTRTGVRGFRAWFTAAPPRGFKKCGCGWSGLPHYSAHPEYKSEAPPRVGGPFYTRANDRLTRLAALQRRCCPFS